MQRVRGGVLEGTLTNLAGLSAIVGNWTSATYTQPGDGVWLIRPATAYKPMEKVFMELYVDPNGAGRLIDFNSTNTDTVAVWFGIFDPSTQTLIGFELVQPGGTYSKQITVEAGDSTNYHLVKADLQGFSNSSSNPAGRGFLEQYSSGGTKWMPFDSNYAVFVGAGQSHSTSTNVAPSGSSSSGSSSGGNASATQIVNANGSSGGSTSTPPGSTVTIVAPSLGGSSGGGGVPATGTGSGPSALTEGTGAAGFAEVNANLKAIAQAIAAQGPNGGGVGGGTIEVDVAGVETRLDTTNEKLTAIDERMALNDADAESIRNKVASESSRDVGAEIGTAYARGEEAGDDLRNSEGVSSIFLVANSPVPSHSSSGSSVTLPVALHGPVLVGGFGASIDLSPTQAGGAQSRLGQDWSWFLSWVRHFIAATAVIWFCKEAIDAAKEACYALGATPQHKLGGSTEIVLAANVAGFSVGVIPAGVMWGVAVIAITAILIAAPTLLAAGIYTVANLSGVVSSFASSAGALAQAAGSSAPGVFAKVFALADAVCPIALLIVIALNRILLSAGAFVQFVALHVGLKLVGMI